MPTLVNRTREVTASEVDDYFKDDTILFYLNRVQDKIVSFLIQTEQNSNSSLRALDELRNQENISTDTLTYTQGKEHFFTFIPFSSISEPIAQITYISYDPEAVVRELTQHNQIKLRWGNLGPTDHEGYYAITKDTNENKAIKLFTASDDSGKGREITIMYIAQPTNIVKTDSTMSELPDRLESALIYGAAKMMIAQESINDQNGQRAVELFFKVYQEELNSNIY